MLWKSIVQRTACWITKATETLRNCNTFCFSSAIVVVRTCLNVTLHVHCLVFFLFLNLRFARVLINLTDVSRNVKHGLGELLL